MQIGVIGAAGTIGSRVVSEALGRGHRVTAFSRDATPIKDNRENIHLEKPRHPRRAGASPRPYPAWTS